MTNLGNATHTVIFSQLRDSDRRARYWTLGTGELIFDNTLHGILKSFRRPGASGVAYDFNISGDVVINIVNQGTNGTFFYNVANTLVFNHVLEFQYTINVDF
jgi:hypothetical protein